MQPMHIIIAASPDQHRAFALTERQRRGCPMP